MKTSFSSRKRKVVQGFHVRNWNGHISENVLNVPELCNWSLCLTVEEPGK